MMVKSPLQFGVSPQPAGVRGDCSVGSAAVRIEQRAPAAGGCEGVT
jgi:hypothetical protein